jgi:hypothetical protein
VHVLIDVREREKYAGSLGPLSLAITHISVAMHGICCKQKNSIETDNIV